MDSVKKQKLLDDFFSKNNFEDFFKEEYVYLNKIENFNFNNAEFYMRLDNFKDSLKLTILCKLDEHKFSKTIVLQ